ncbi:hypothetical protein [Nonomuraea zeae]|uniref:Uncharacterized protein n=1 Tax=Nonomuraea zeae TaxID=1642303 RepID=A0A5S4GCR3_9ACTN|nr:hypothetical protein [Nonomuraea zeae]TMR30786.1 hypothetical protein ETD85_27940 [Nonomuraea zeae]
MDLPAASAPVVCDMSTAADTPQERLDEYRRLFRQSFASKERIPGGVRLRLRARPGVAEWVRDLAAREKACCAFFAFEVTEAGEEVIWDAAVIDDDAARAVLEEFYRLPSSGAL